MEKFWTCGGTNDRRGVKSVSQPRGCPPTEGLIHRLIHQKGAAMGCARATSTARARAVIRAAGYDRRAMLSRREFLLTATVSVLAMPLAAEAQPTGKVWRLGVLRIGSGESWTTLREALRELGYVEGRNLVIVDRTADGRLD